MSSLTLYARRGGLLLSRKARPIISTVLKASFSTRPQLKKDKVENIHYRHDFYGDEGAEMREFFDSIEASIRKSMKLMKDEMTADDLRTFYSDVKKVYAVDGPDGVPESDLADEMREINKLFDNVSQHKKEVQARLDKLTEMMREAYAVESPDGEVDGHLQEEMQEVNRIIDEAATFKAKKVSDTTKEDIQRKRASDPEHW